jgi:RNA polymerase sigma-70 factor (ECF subfamily)
LHGRGGVVRIALGPRKLLACRRLAIDPPDREQPEDPYRTRWAREDEDVRLMLDFQRGRSDAFAELVRRNQAKVYAVAYRLVRDHGQAEDLTQEAFLRVFRTAKRYKPMAKFSTWLYRIAANVALNALRSRRKLRMGTLETPDGDDETSFHRDVPDTRLPVPQARLDAGELEERIAAAIDQLPESQRIAIALNRFEDLSYQDIAKVLGCSSMAVKSLLSRARTNLRHALVQYLGPEFGKNLPNP